MSLNLKFGNIIIELHVPWSLNENFYQLLSPFVVSGIKSTYLLKVEISEKPVWDKDYTIRCDYFYREDDNNNFLVGNTQFLLDVKLDKNMAVASIVDFSQNAAIIFACIKWYLSFLAIENGGVPFHSSSVFRNGRSFLFMGKSGMGKSTICRLLSEKWKKGNDEYNIVLFDRDILKSCPSPFVPDSDHNGITEGNMLQCIYILKWSAQNRIEEINGCSGKYFNLLGNVYTKPANAYLGEKLLDNINRISNSVPVKILHFNNNQSVCSYFEQVNGDI